MNNKLLKTLEFDKILAKISEYAASGSAREIIPKILPETDFAAAEKALGQTAEAMRILNNYAAYPLMPFDDLGSVIEKAKVFSLLGCPELLRTARHLKAARLLKSGIEGLKDESLKFFNALCGQITPCRSMEEKIEENILSETEISDCASDKLRAVRVKIRNTNAAVREKMSSYLKSHSKYLQDNIVTQRGDRFVLAVKQEYKGNIPGLVHDQSSSGATLFIEPMQVVELNNQLKTLIIEEQHEIERILYEYSSEVAGIADILFVNQAALTVSDVVFSKAQYANAIRAVRPSLNQDGIINFKRARHPLIDKEKVVPVDVELGKDYRILIITGPNTGGKTVTLKTVGLLTLMASSGIFIPCDEGSGAGFFDNIFCDLGDEQSIEQNLSTFSSHMTNIAGITAGLTPRSLSLLDELGAGTDPKEGAALAYGIIRYISESKSSAVITTHYSELKDLHFSDPNIQNASMQFDISTYLPTYRLQTGIPGTSCALQIARHLKINPVILDYASSKLDKGKLNYDRVLQNAEAAFVKAEREREATAVIRSELLAERSELKAERERLNAMLEKVERSAKAEARQKAAAATAKAENLIEQMKELLSQPREDALFEMGRLKNEIKNMESEFIPEEAVQNVTVRDAPDSEICPGRQVYIKSLKGRGEIMEVSLKKREAKVRMGRMIIMVNFSDIAFFD